MLVTLIVVLTGLVAVQADCGHCPLEDIHNTQERLQAQAYNAMPKTWKASPLNSNDTKAFILGRYGFGPWACANDCVTNKGSKDLTGCDYKAYIKYRKPKVYTRLMYSLCANKYRDERNKACIERPVWDNLTERMWCRTAYLSDDGITSGHTHFPICAATGQMCIYSK